MNEYLFGCYRPNLTLKFCRFFTHHVPLRFRQSALIPAHIRGIGKIMSICNSRFSEIAYDSVDTVSSCIVICGLIFFLTVATIFICIQVNYKLVLLVYISCTACLSFLYLLVDHCSWPYDLTVLSLTKLIQNSHIKHIPLK